MTPRALTAWSRVTTVEASHFDRTGVRASIGQLRDYEPYIYRTRDAGKTWQTIAKGLPAGVYVHVVEEDPMRRGLLFAGTERGVYVSFDDGDSWRSLQLNLPATSMRDIEIPVYDPIAATHGRGFWVLDDVSVLRQVNDSVATSSAYLFKPADAVNVIQAATTAHQRRKTKRRRRTPERRRHRLLLEERGVGTGDARHSRRKRRDDPFLHQRATWRARECGGGISAERHEHVAPKA